MIAQLSSEIQALIIITIILLITTTTTAATTIAIFPLVDTIYHILPYAYTLIYKDTIPHVHILG